jgi:hypothetical protein
LPPLAVALRLGAEPEALGRAVPRPCGDIVIGGPSFRDGSDQNSTLAALIVSGSISGMAK